LLLKTAPVLNNSQEPPKLPGYCYPNSSSNAIQANITQSDLTKLLPGQRSSISTQSCSALRLPAAWRVSDQSESSGYRAISQLPVSDQTDNSCELPAGIMPAQVKIGTIMIRGLLRGFESGPKSEMAFPVSNSHSAQSIDCKQLPIHNQWLRRSESRHFAIPASTERKEEINSCESTRSSDLLLREERNEVTRRFLRNNGSDSKQHNLSGNGHARGTRTATIGWLPIRRKQPRSVECSLCAVFSRPILIDTSNSCEPVAQSEPARPKGRRIRIRSLLREIRITPETVRGSPLEPVRLPYCYGKK
jgi:hypothetical protein